MNPTKRNQLRSAVINRRNPSTEIIGLVEVPTSSCSGCMCYHKGACGASFTQNCFNETQYFQYRKLN